LDTSTNGGKIAFNLNPETFHFNQENKGASLAFRPGQNLDLQIDGTYKEYAQRYVKGGGYYSFGDASIEINGDVSVCDMILWSKVEVEAKIGSTGNSGGISP
jgi:hypothetical protein